MAPKGERVTAAVEKKLLLGKPGKAPHPGRARERYEAVVRYLRESEVFEQYKKNPEAYTISEGELRRLLGGTLETPSRVLRQNFHFYLDAVEQYDDTAVLSFLQACRGTAKNLFRAK